MIEDIVSILRKQFVAVSQIKGVFLREKELQVV